jgi:hypothetical protein
LSFLEREGQGSWWWFFCKETDWMDKRKRKRGRGGEGEREREKG